MKNLAQCADVPIPRHKHIDFFAINISFIPTVMQYFGIPSKSPPQFINEFMVFVSLEILSTLMALFKNSSFMQLSPGFGGLLNAKCPFIPIWLSSLQ